jgi:hypothetical protein
MGHNNLSMPDGVTMVASTATLPAWSKPVMIEMNSAAQAQGDPTISDDGLGDGLFS